jgi:hypothetical protein
MCHTCFAGTGGAEYNNIANYVDEIVGDRRIIAPRNNLNTCHIQVEEIYPLNVSLMKNGKDMAYRVNFRFRELISFFSEYPILSKTCCVSNTC